MKRIVLLLAISLVCTIVFGQTRTAPPAGPKMFLTGTIYDTNGAVITNGRVAARGADGEQYYVTTNDEGIYKFELPLTVYKLSASAPGFCPTTIQRFIVVNSTYGKMSLDLVLEIGKPETGCNREITMKRKPQRRSLKTLKRIA